LPSRACEEIEMSASPDGCPLGRQGSAQAPTTLDKGLRVFSFVTLAMTVPQVLATWHGDVSGVSLLSWSTYLVSACLWLVYGLRKHDKTIYLPCLGWIALDAAIVAGVLLHS
jgi:uncharacterized protein with PQ loop repeat